MQTNQGGEQGDRDLDSHRIGPKDQDRVAGPDLTNVPSSLAELATRLEGIPVSIWTYDHEPDQLHVGPMAQDFEDALGLGVQEIGGIKQISVVDYLGALLATIQHQGQRIAALEAKG